VGVFGGARREGPCWQACVGLREPAPQPGFGYSRVRPRVLIMRGAPLADQATRRTRSAGLWTGGGGNQSFRSAQKDVAGGLYILMRSLSQWRSRSSAEVARRWPVASR